VHGKAGILVIERTQRVIQVEWLNTDSSWRWNRSYGACEYSIGRTTLGELTQYAVAVDSIITACWVSTAIRRFTATAAIDSRLMHIVILRFIFLYVLLCVVNRQINKINQSIKSKYISACQFSFTTQSWQYKNRIK